MLLWYKGQKEDPVLAPLSAKKNQCVPQAWLTVQDRVNSHTEKTAVTWGYLLFWSNQENVGHADQ